MKYIDIDCYERGCACASSSRFAGENTELVPVIRLTEVEYYALTRDHTWLSVDEEQYNKLDPAYRMKCLPIKE